MISSNDKAICALPVASVASTATAVLTFSKLGNAAEEFRYANILFHVGTSATTSAVMTTLKLTESDTVTNASSQTAIVALTGGTVTSSSVGFVIPTALAGGGNLVEFQLDLRKRKKYVGLSATPAQTLVLGATALLSRASESQDTTTDMQISNLEATTATGVELLVNN